LNLELRNSGTELRRGVWMGNSGARERTTNLVRALRSDFFSIVPEFQIQIGFLGSVEWFGWKVRTWVLHLELRNSGTELRRGV
jgi:hypothetical protein